MTRSEWRTYKSYHCVQNNDTFTYLCAAKISPGDELKPLCNFTIKFDRVCSGGPKVCDVHSRGQQWDQQR